MTSCWRETDCMPSWSIGNCENVQIFLYRNVRYLLPIHVLFYSFIKNYIKLKAMQRMYNHEGIPRPSN